MARDLSTSRAILIGNGIFTDKTRIPPLPAAACVAAMSALLTSDLCGWPQDRIEPLQDVAAPSDLARRIVQAVRGVQGVLLVYYVGHGIRTREGQLALALGDTDADPEALPHTAMLYENLASIMRGCPAATKLVILDCCHAELGNKANYQFQSVDLTDAYPVDGLYFIGASKTHQKAMAPLNGGLTYFTETLVDTVHGGILSQPPELRLDQIFLELRARLVRDNLPEPVESGTRGARQYPFALNAAHRTAPAPATADPARTSRLRILGDAERAAAMIGATVRGLTHYGHAMALLDIAKAMASDDPDHSHQLARQAMRIITSAGLEPMVMVSAAEAMATVDPERAERLARTITEPAALASALACVAKRVAAADPDRAERIACSVTEPIGQTPASTDPSKQASALAEVVKELAAADPDRAERIARGITEPITQASALCDVIKAVAGADPKRAEFLADTVIGLGQSLFLSHVVGVMALTNPVGAERIARAITDRQYQDRALQDIARSVAAVDAERAERIAGTVVDTHERAYVQWLVATRVAERDPGCAERIASAIAEPDLESSALTTCAAYLVESDPGRARGLLDAAERVARSIPDRARQDSALKSVAEMAAYFDAELALRIALTVSDPDSRFAAIRWVARSVTVADSGHAESLARAITSPYERALALAEIAAIMAAHSIHGASSLFDDAERTAATILDLSQRTYVYTLIAREIAAYDSDRGRRLIDQAEVTARTITDSSFIVRTSDLKLMEIVYQILSPNAARINRLFYDHAERIARTIPGLRQQAQALTYFAKTLFADDAGRSERAALAITQPEGQVKALIEIAAMHVSST